MNTYKKYHLIYGRKSKYTGKGESIENQIELCRQKIFSKYSNTTEEDIIVFIDEGFTGANTNRPDFQKMMEIIRKNEALTVTCYRLDRISRNVGDFCNTINELQDYGVEFMSIREDFDTSTPMGKAMMLICSVFAQLERDTIAERIRDNMMELAKTGRWLGGNTPTGFKSQEVKSLAIDGKTKKLFRLVEIPAEKSLVILLKEKFLEIKSQTGLETYTIQNNLKTKQGKMFTRWSLVNILANPVYSMADKDSFEYFTKLGAQVIGDIKDYDKKHGLMVYNKTNQLTGKGKKDNPVTEWIVAVGKHKGFWSGKEYVEIQELLNMGANKRFRKPAVNSSLLSGLLKCSFCDSYMRPKVYSSNMPNGDVKFSYLCSLKEKSRKKLCNHKNLNGNAADKLVIKIVKSLVKDNRNFYQAIKSLVAKNINILDQKTNELNTLQSEIKKNESNIEILIDRIKIVPPDIVSVLADEISKLKKANKELNKQINFLNVDKIVVDEKSDNTKIILKTINTYFNNFEKLDLVSKRILVKSLITSAYSDGENLFLNLLGTRDTLKNLKLPSGDNSK